MPYSEHALFTDPEVNNLKLFRYLDYTKLVSLVRRSELFFCRADKFSDPFEGSYPRREIRYRPESERRAVEGIGGTYDPQKAAENLEAFTKFNLKYRSLVVFNCWHYNTVESLAMWKLYLKSDEGVAIESTLDNFKNAFDNYEQAVYIGKVRYIDYENDIFFDKNEFPHVRVNTFVPCIHKRSFFDHEKEYRAVVDISNLSKKDAWLEYDWDSEESTNGVFVPVILPTLINRIIVSPYSDDWFFNLVRDSIAEVLPEVSVVRSKVDMEPLF